MTISQTPIIFVSGIDTDAGKTYATAWLVQQIQAEGKTAITQKFIQTGNTGRSEDIEKHRELCHMPWTEADARGLTAPIIFTYPASAQLAAEIDGKTIDTQLIEDCTTALSQMYDCVLIEGAGGLMTPITDDFYTIDYIAQHGYPVALVTNSKLGSINHTILSLEALKSRGIPVHSVVFNHHFDHGNEVIAKDTRGFVGRYVAKHFPGVEVLDFE